MTVNEVRIGNIPVGRPHPMVLIAGPCVIETEEIALETAAGIQKIAQKLSIPWIYKSSYLKDNRSAATTYQGPGLDEGLKILLKVKNEFGVPVLSDVHDQHEVEAAAEVLDVLQIPAYLSMQTSLVLAAAKTGRCLNIKKGQFLHPSDMNHIIKKIEYAGNRKILLTDRGTFFGYHNLVMDMRSFQIMRETGYPVVADPTHAIRVYGISSSDPKGGAPHFVPGLARAATAAGIDAMFIETHPDCRNAKCDAASMWPLQKLEALLEQLKAVDDLVRSFGENQL